MAFCGKCGAQVQEGMAFCSRCGAPMAPVARGTSGPAAGSAGMTSNVAALLSYVLGFVTGILFLVLEPYKNDRFVRFHAFQSIFYSLAFIVFMIVWNNLIWLAFGWSSILWPVFFLVSTLIWLAAFVYWLFLMYKAYNNQRYMIPIIGELAAKQAG